MDRLPRLRFCFILSWFLWLCSCAICLADYVYIYPPREVMVAELRNLAFNASIAFLLTVIVEYIVVYWYLGLSRNIATRLLFWVVLVNFITNPVLQLAYYFFRLSVMGGHWLAPWPQVDATTVFQHVAILLILELIVVVVEYGLFRLIFRRFYRKGFLKEPVSRLNTLIISLVANAASLLLSIIVQFSFRGLWHV